MPPAAVVSAKYLLSYTVGGAIVARQNSLVGDGSLKVQMEHYFAQVLPASHLPALGGGELSIDIGRPFQSVEDKTVKVTLVFGST